MHDMDELERLQVSAHLVDARGKACPAPIIDLAKALRTQEQVELWADDPAAWGDLRAFVEATGHRLVTGAPERGPLRAVILRRGSA